MQCPNCEKNVSEHARFCDQCGHALEAPPQPAPEIRSELQFEEPLDSVEEETLLPDDNMNIVEEQVAPYDLLPAIEPAEREPLPLAVASEADQPEYNDPSLPEPDAISSVAPTDELPAAGPRLVLEDELGEDETSYPLSPDHAIIVGREDPIDGIYPDIDLTPHDTYTGVSRQHASLHEQGGQWFIQDLASTNYTIVNRRRLTPHEDYLLEDGDALRFGRVAAAFRV